MGIEVLINEALSDIPRLRYNHPKFKKVSSDKTINIKNDEGEQGEYDEFIEIYSLGQDDLHIKLVLHTNSYGYDEAINSISLVKPVIKQVTDFELVK